MQIKLIGINCSVLYMPSQSCNYYQEKQKHKNAKIEMKEMLNTFWLNICAFVRVTTCQGVFIY